MRCFPALGSSGHFYDKANFKNKRIPQTKPPTLLHTFLRLYPSFIISGMVTELAVARISLARLPSLAGQPYPQPHRESRNVVLTLPTGTASRESRVGSAGHTVHWDRWAGVTLYVGRCWNTNQHCSGPTAGELWSINVPAAIWGRKRISQRFA